MDLTAKERTLSDARIAVIGSMLLDSNIVGEVMLRLTPDDFGSGTLRSLYDACCRLFSRMAPIDPVTLVAEAGGPYEQTVREILEVTPTAANWEAYVDALRDGAQLTRLKQAAMAITTASTVQEARENAERVSALLASRRDIRIVPIQQGIREFYERQADCKPPEYLKWGLGPLDDVLKLTGGRFVIIGGYPSAGKTMLASQLAYNISQKKRVGIFSLETDDWDLYDRLVAQVAHVPYDAIQAHNLTSDNFTTVAAMGNAVENRPLDIIPGSGLSVADIQAISLSRHYDVIFIDYVQLIEGRGKDRFETVTNISLDLHRLAVRTGITVIGLAQLSRPEKGKKNPVPTRSSLRESGQLEQDADAILLLYLDDEDLPEGDRILKVAKQKNGPLGYLRLGFYPKHMCFYPKGRQYEMPPAAVKGPFKPVTKEEAQMALPF